MTSEITPTLSADEKKQLAANEKIIREGIETFFDVGNALRRIHDGNLYRLAFGSFADYCERKWNISRSRAFQLMGAAEVASTMVDSNPDLPAITSERQARELASVPPSERADVYRDAIDRTGGAPTAAAIRDAREERQAPQLGRIRPIARPMPTVPATPVQNAVDFAKEMNPDPDRDYAPWRAKFMAAIAGSFRTTQFSDEDIVAFATDDLVEEYGRMARAFGDRHAEIVAARTKLATVRHLKAV